MIVATKQGRVQGIEGPGGTVRFLGIPYAAPPVGARRWREALAPEPWTGIRKAFGWGPKCPQPQLYGLAMEILPVETQSEDCLYCNIWTQKPPSEGLPVAVWLHGGGFLSGSSAWPDGEAFARDGVVFVSINYRLGALGFLCLDQLVEGFQGTGNLGLSDQIAALNWVKENIAAFGGDPDNVTVFGESAGAISIGALLASEAAKGLFRKAITQSGAAHHARTIETATAIAECFCDELGVSRRNREALLCVTHDELTATTTRLLSTSSNRIEGLLARDEPLGGPMLFKPVIDGHILDCRPIDAIRNGSAANIDLVSGINAEEWRLVVFGAGRAAAEVMDIPDENQFAPGTGLSGPELIGRYKGIMAGGSRLDIHCAIQSDNVFAVPARRLADAQSHHANVYCYVFAWKTSIMDGILGSCHGLEIPFVFDLLKETPALVGDDPPIALARSMHQAWVAFMKAGRPNAKSIPEWPAYDTSSRATLILDVQPSVALHPFDDRIRLWPSW